MRRSIYILLLLLVSMAAWGQTVCDSVDRGADDFVIASLVVADPGEVLYSVTGHACLRMQCPTYGMDYCFSYESESVEHRVADFLAGKLYMGMFAVPMEEYCAPYRAEGRGVREYRLNLPIEKKRELWRALDEEMMKGSMQPYDYYHRGCARGCVQFVQEVLDEPIMYDPSLYTHPLTARELGQQNSEEAPWTSFVCHFIGGTETDIPLYGADQLLVPADLAQAWQRATYKGEPVLDSEAHVLVEGEPQHSDIRFSPMMLAIVLLLLSIANLYWRKPYGDWAILGIQTAVGLFMTYLVFISDLCCTSWNWLIIPFNPLPAVFWHWRRYWAMPYAVVLSGWCIAMAGYLLFSHMLCDWVHIFIVIAFTMLYCKQSLYIKV